MQTCSRSFGVQAFCQSVVYGAGGRQTRTGLSVAAEVTRGAANDANTSSTLIVNAVVAAQRLWKKGRTDSSLRLRRQLLPSVKRIGLHRSNAAGTPRFEQRTAPVGGYLRERGCLAHAARVGAGFLWQQMARLRRETSRRCALRDFAVHRMAFAAGALVLSSLGATAAQQSPVPPKDPQRLTVRGRDILAPDGRPIRLRGFNLLWWAPPTAQDAADVQELGANCVRYMFGYQPKGRFEPEQLDYLEQQVRLFTRRGLWVIPNVHTFERKEGDTKQGPWDSPELQREFLDLWTHVLTRLRDEPFIAAWEPLNEPHDVKDDRLREWHT
ncbi:MAG: glycoside hydrolase family 5 protein, partial [Planctomycetes bacterium]|nr:glycoside hydrolase family 5 protein [Planctomycetota bacterium]